MNSTPLSSRDGINIALGQKIEVQETGSDITQHRFAVRVNSYFYGLSRIVRSGAEQELLHFHWERQLAAGHPYPPGHLHIGVGLLARPTPIRPGDFHHAHIPTGRISLESVIRFAIIELGVNPLNPDWIQILDDTEAQTLLFRTT